VWAIRPWLTPSQKAITERECTITIYMTEFLSIDNSLQTERANYPHQKGHSLRLLPLHLCKTHGGCMQVSIFGRLTSLCSTTPHISSLHQRGFGMTPFSAKQEVTMTQKRETNLWWQFIALLGLSFDASCLWVHGKEEEKNMSLWYWNQCSRVPNRLLLM